MNREDCLKAAARCVLKDRAKTHGEAENNFRTIAGFWELYLEARKRSLMANDGIGSLMLNDFDVAAMMVLMKVARIAANPTHADSWVDIAGYAACGVDLSTNEPNDS